jgi:hypothetical protein
MKFSDVYPKPQYSHSKIFVNEPTRIFHTYQPQDSQLYCIRGEVEMWAIMGFGTGIILEIPLKASFLASFKFS